MMVYEIIIVFSARYLLFYWFIYVNLYDTLELLVSSVVEFKCLFFKIEFLEKSTSSDTVYIF